MTYQEHMKQVMLNKKRYIELLMSTKRTGMSELIDHLEKNRFFTSPASAQYHNAFDGGLCDHSLKVLDILVAKCEQLVPGKYSESTMIVTALLHDICKAGKYINGQRWRKDAHNKWESYPGYSYADEVVHLGHGSKSVYIARTFIELTATEAMGIFWHMGLTTTPNTYDFSNAAAECPLAVLMHTADIESSYVMESRGIVEDKVSQK